MKPFLSLILALVAGVTLCGQSSMNQPVAKNIILLIGDGMGLGQISAAMYSNNNQLVLEEFPVIGLQKTHSADDLITDSAASATAMATGTKTNNAEIGMDVEKHKVYSILEESRDKEMATGVIVTAQIVHATPAAFFGHRMMRIMYDPIATDLLNADLDLMIGGGMKHFTSDRTDHKNLLKGFQEKGYKIFGPGQKSFRKLSVEDYEKILYFTAEDKPRTAMDGRNYLPDATKFGIDFLEHKAGDKGFFCLVEGSQIDWAGHDNNSSMIIRETMDFARAIENAMAFAKADGNTLVIVTADHETGGLAINPGSRMNRLKLAWTSNGHTATLIPVFAYGPQAEQFRGIYDNTEIYHKMRAALGWKEIDNPYEESVGGAKSTNED